MKFLCRCQLGGNRLLNSLIAKLRTGLFGLLFLRHHPNKKWHCDIALPTSTPCLIHMRRHRGIPKIFPIFVRIADDAILIKFNLQPLPHDPELPVQTIFVSWVAGYRRPYSLLWYLSRLWFLKNLVLRPRNNLRLKWLCAMCIILSKLLELL